MNNFNYIWNVIVLKPGRVLAIISEKKTKKKHKDKKKIFKYFLYHGSEMLSHDCLVLTNSSNGLLKMSKFITVINIVYVLVFMSPER
uniref:Uncharacterized protein n=1 Tax=Octopus bimaculoides TaxID=37653 RepID=A0A0L8FM61_OCTBM